MTAPKPGSLFHFTHVEHLPSIFETGYVLSDSEIAARRIKITEAGNPEVKKRRRHRPVPCGAGGVVADYVPFYFGVRSPMMFLLQTGRVPSFQGDVYDLVYLVSDVLTVEPLGLRCVVTDRNAATEIAAFSDDLKVLGNLFTDRPASDHVDWPLMRQKMWNDTPAEPDRMERRMAEFLVHERFPVEAITQIAVQNSQLKSKIEHMFEFHQTPPIVVRSRWNY